MSRLRFWKKQGCFSSSVSSGNDGIHDTPPLSKLRFPKYEGNEYPIDWLHKAAQFFHAYATPDDQKVWATTFYMKGMASQWYNRLEKNHGEPSWKDFIDAVNKRFGPSMRSNPFGRLMFLYHTRSVADYQEQFLTLLGRFPATMVSTPATPGALVKLPACAAGSLACRLQRWHRAVEKFSRDHIKQ